MLQDVRFLKARTVEAGVPSVSSSKDTAAYALDSFGRIISSLGTDDESGSSVVHLDVLSTDVPERSHE